MSVLDVLAASPGLFIGACVALGLAIGSFLNVVIYRFPIMLERQWREQCAEVSGQVADQRTGSQPTFNLVFPRSSCPRCNAPIAPWQNIPLVSWAVLRGRCANCGSSISARYPFIEALTGVLSGVVAWKFGFGWPALAGLVLTWYLIALAFIDLDHQLLPDALTLPLLWLGLFTSFWGGPGNEQEIPVDLRSSLLGAMAGYVSLWSVYHLFRLLTGKEGMGYGDFKLFAALGAWFGWQMLLPIILIAASVGSIAGIGLITLRRHDRGAPMPFGPFLAASGWLMLVFGQRLLSHYLGLFPGHQ